MNFEKNPFSHHPHGELPKLSRTWLALPASSSYSLAHQLINSKLCNRNISRRSSTPTHMQKKQKRVAALSADARRLDTTDNVILIYFKFPIIPFFRRFRKPLIFSLTKRLDSFLRIQRCSPKIPGPEQPLYNRYPTYYYTELITGRNIARVLA